MAVELDYWVEQIQISLVISFVYVQKNLTLIFSKAKIHLPTSKYRNFNRKSENETITWNRNWLLKRIIGFKATENLSAAFEIAKNRFS